MCASDAVGSNGISDRFQFGFDYSVIYVRKHYGKSDLHVFVFFCEYFVIYIFVQLLFTIFGSSPCGTADYNATYRRARGVIIISGICLNTE